MKEKSSIRRALYATIALDAWLIMLMSASIIADIARATPINWQGIAAYMGAISLLTGSVAWAKSYQKKYEKQ